MVFSNNRLFVLFPWERDLRLATVVLGIHRRRTLQHEQTIFGEEIHTLITFMVSVMAYNTVDGRGVGNKLKSWTQILKSDIRNPKQYFPIISVKYGNLYHLN